MDTPDLDQLGRIASTVKRDRWPDGSMPCGITHEELISVGYMAYITAKNYPWARARFAMIDHLRETLSPVSGPLTKMGRTKAEALSEDLVDEPPSRYTRRLSRGDVNTLRTFCHRVLSERKATIAIRTLIYGDSIEIIADELHISRARAAMIRSQAFGEIRSVVGASHGV